MAGRDGPLWALGCMSVYSVLTYVQGAMGEACMCAVLKQLERTSRCIQHHMLSVTSTGCCKHGYLVSAAVSGTAQACLWALSLQHSCAVALPQLSSHNNCALLWLSSEHAL